MASWRGDILALRANWGAVRSGWRAALADADALALHRRVQIDTPESTAAALGVVLRTRVRLTGDIETEVLSDWLTGVALPAREATTQLHFAAVAAAMSGVAMLPALLRLATHAVTLGGLLAGMGREVYALAMQPPAALIMTAVTDWQLLAASALALFGVLARWAMRLRLRALFGRGLRAGSVAAP